MNAVEAGKVEKLTALEAGTTGDREWDATQIRLIRSGQIHSHALPRWVHHIRCSCSDDDAALQWALDALRRHVVGGIRPEARLAVLNTFARP